MPPSSSSSNGLAKLAALFSGLVFGIYWIFLRKLEEIGFSGLWAFFAFNIAPIVLLLPVFWVRRRQFLVAKPRFHITSLMMGLGYVLYAGAFLYTEVVKVIALFYLMPVWGFIAARFFLGERITLIRWLCMMLAMTGLGVLFYSEAGLPIPDSIGDYMALIAGFIWACSALLLLTGEGHPIDYTISFFFWSTLIALLLCLYASKQGIMPTIELTFLRQLPWWVWPVGLLILIPGTIATVYAPSKLNPGVAGLLFMAEISVGMITAALFAGEPFGHRQVIGVILITMAGLAEPLKDLLWTNRT